MPQTGKQGIIDVKPLCSVSLGKVVASYFLHLVLAYRRAQLDALDGERASAFVLGAIAPDAAVDAREKRGTHYSVHAGVTWGYRFRAFDREYASFRRRSPLHAAVYCGYRHHLRVDEAWLRCCGHRALWRSALRERRGDGTTLGRYYEEMSALDAYYGATTGGAYAEQALVCLLDADVALLPDTIDAGRLGAVRELVASRARSAAIRLTARYAGKLLRQEEVERFLDRATAVPALCGRSAWPDAAREGGS